MVDTDRPLWKTAAVRHLDWLCHAEPLVRCGPVFMTSSVLPDDIDARLQWLDDHPETLLDSLGESARYRLGHYFESLYHFLLEDILGWPVLLRNTPIRGPDGRTLGELDFIVRNGVTAELEHHEVAVKFYLGLFHDHTTRWYGPNAHDRLDIKTQHMLTHQCRMTERPETLTILASAGLCEPIRPALILPGTLFSPHSAEFGPAGEPAWANLNHDRGWWIKHHQLFQADTANWALLKKPEWISRYQQTIEPDRTETKEALAGIAINNRPRLFAEMGKRSDGRGYEEVSRWFVVPDHWPGPQPARPDDRHKDRPFQT